MLVLICYTRTGNVASTFDEDEYRRHPELETKEWAEYEVSWRGPGSPVELYENKVEFLHTPRCDYSV